MEPQQIISMLRRRAWLILCWGVAFAAIVGIASSALQSPVYESSAQVLLRSSDPTAPLNPSAQSDPAGYAAAQAVVIRSPAIARVASARLAGAPPPDALLRDVRVVTGTTNSILTIIASAEDPADAQATANAFAKAYVSNRRARAIANVQSAIDDTTDRLNNLELQINTAASEAEKGAAQDLYNSLFAKRAELKDSLESPSDVELASEADLPGSPVSPNPKRDAALGATAGLLIGLGIELLRLKFGDKVRTAEELEQITGQQVLAELPDDAVASAISRVATRPGAFSESVRTLRTSLQFLGVERPVRRIVVSSASPGDGKSTVAANLAVAYAAAGFVTVLVSGDLRRPQVETLFGSPYVATGLSTLLATPALHAPPATNGDSAALYEDMRLEHNVLLGEYLRMQSINTAIPNLTVIPGGPPPPNPAELLGSTRMLEVLDVLGEEADVIIIDTPPALVVTDAVVLARAADGVLLVASAGTSTRRDLTRLIGLYEGVNVPVLGAVLNRARRTRNRSAYYDAYNLRRKPARASRR